MVLEQRDLSRMLETAIVAAHLAGQRAMEEINFIKASIKNNREMVTQTDFAMSHKPQQPKATSHHQENNAGDQAPAKRCTPR